MIRSLIGVFVIFMVAQFSFACDSATDSSEVVVLMDNLASSRGMEFVYGDRFPQINPYGSYGSSFVLDFIDRQGVANSVFFLARRKNQFYKDEAIESPSDLIKNYDYFYVYAEKESQSGSFKIKDIISEGAGLMGMSLYHGWIDIESKKLASVKDGSNIDSSSIDRRKLGTAILISSESSTKFLFNYNGKWIQSSEIEL